MVLSEWRPAHFPSAYELQGGANLALQPSAFRFTFYHS